jgi:recombination protein RecA
VIEYYGRLLSPDVGRAVQRLRMRTVSALRNKHDTKRVATVLKSIEKQFGAGVLAPIKMMRDRADVRCVPTGFQELDDIISGLAERVGDVWVAIPGTGRGVPRGRIMEIYGPESSGKTTLALQLVYAFQQRGYTAAYVDVEQSLDMNYAERIGVDVESVLYSQGGDTAEETLEIVDTLTRKELVDLIVVDSVAALVPEKELKGEIGDAAVGVHARLMSQTLRKLTRRLRKGHRTTIVFLNQTRMKIGVMFGNPETTTGGNALKFYASVRLRTSSMGQKKAGIRAKVKCAKTKVGIPFAEAFMDIFGGRGVQAMHSSDPRAKEKRTAKGKKGKKREQETDD